MPRSIINVLLVFSNPRGTDPLRLLTEERVIQESIALSKKRKDIKLTTCPAATIHDVSRALLNGTFQVIHISGHGSGSGLILETEQGGQYLVHPPTLAELFKELIQESHKSIRESRSKHLQHSLYLFVYGFGLRSIPVCDLLSLIKAS